MRKIKLDLDALEIESFPTADDARAEQGTVRGHNSGYQCSTDYSEDNPIHHSYSGDGYCICMPGYTAGADGCSRVGC